ncbi:MAG: NAD(P)/FAD-dependent oxidoreductase [Thaumarchaeota archaeon]|nr:NAD(P)/FAD-dependent oxidoreductase [Nitrososphaerota archaeon]
MSAETGREVYDLTIIGAGPVGLYAAFCAGLRNMRVKMVEALHEAGGQCAVLYPEKFIYDAPGFPKILAKDLARQLLVQAQQFRPTILFEEEVQNLKVLEDHTMLLEGSREKHYSKTVLVAAGVGAFAPNKLEALGVNEFEGKGVSYFVKDKNALRGKRVLIVGGGDSAVDWALTLRDWAQEVTLVHRRDVFRAHERSVAELMSSDVKLRMFWEVTEIHGSDHVEAVTIHSSKTDEESYMPVDAVIVSIGFKADLGSIKNWGFQIDGRTIKVNGRMETNIPGVYAAGDIASPEGSVKLGLLATGFAQAAVAVNHAKHYLDPSEPVEPEYSSTKRLLSPHVTYR